MSILAFFWGGGGVLTFGGYVQRGVEIFLTTKNSIEHLKLTNYKN